LPQFASPEAVEQTAKRVARLLNGPTAQLPAPVIEALRERAIYNGACHEGLQPDALLPYVLRRRAFFAARAVELLLAMVMEREGLGL
jgi:hypothetical protein